MAQYIYTDNLGNSRFLARNLKLITQENNNLFPGDGTLSGIITEGGSSPKEATISLFETETKNFVKTVISNPTTGYYEFSGIDKKKSYDVVAADPNVVWEKKISSSRVPAAPNISIEKVKMFGSESLQVVDLTFDLFKNYVVSCLRFEGANNSTTITDSAGKTWSVAGNAKISTSQFKFGTSSLLLDGTGDYIESVDSVDWNLNHQPFTIEGWLYFNTAQTNWALCSQWSSTAANGAWAVFGDSGVLKFRFRDTASAQVDISYTWTPTANTWYHIAVSRDTDNTFRIFVDGTLSASAIHTKQIQDSTNPLRVGALQDFAGTYDLNAYVGGLRITKDICRYTSNFIPDSFQFNIK